MGSGGSTARGRIRQRRSIQSEYARFGDKEQYLALDSPEEHNQVSLDKRADDGHFRHKASFAGYVAVHAESGHFEPENHDCDRYSLEPRGTRSCATAECATAPRLRIRPRHRGRHNEAEELQIEGSES